MDQSILIRIPAILICLTIHEYAHGYMALLKGDDTASLQGRLTFNPISHLDPIGTLMMLFGPFGWAKPVPVNPNRLEKPRRDMGLVAFAGPASNMILAVIILLIVKFGGFREDFIISTNALFSNGQVTNVLYALLAYLFYFNLGLAIFNLLPVFPLDGSHIVTSLLPYDKVHKWEQISKRLPIFLFGILIADRLFNIPLFTILIEKPIFHPWLNFWTGLI